MVVRFKETYLSCTYHYIYRDILKSSVLLTAEPLINGTSENIAVLLNRIFIDYDISGKIVGIITDNVSNIKNSVIDRLLETHEPCIAHTLHISVTEAIAKITFL